MPTLVPNQQPEKPSPRRLAIIGESPGSDEPAWHVCCACGNGFSTHRSYTGSRCPMCGGAGVHRPTPFVGQSGRLLNTLLAEVGIDRHACFVGNVCQQQPPRNEIKAFKWDGTEIQSGLEQLTRDLVAYAPHMVLALGNTPLRALRGPGKWSISDWRGSLWLAEAIVPGVKAIATYHPAALLRDYSLTPYVRNDLKRLRDELPTDALVLPKRDIVIAHPDNGWTPARIADWCRTQRQLGTPQSVDLEGVVDYIECVGFATGPEFAFVVPFINTRGESVWDDEEEYQVWLALKDLLEAPEVPKILTNALYDAFVLAWSYGIVVRPLADDTMLKWHEMYCELEKSLAVQTSMLTREPFYKFQRKKAMREAEDANVPAT